MTTRQIPIDCFKVIDQRVIKRILPHRAPFLFVEEARLLGDGRIRGTSTWRSDSYLLQGHFPGEPIVPGVLIIEAVAQLGGVLLCLNESAEAITEDERVPSVRGFLSMVRKASFHCVLRPDRAIDVVGSVRRLNASAYLFEATCTHGGDASLVARVEVILALRSEQAANAPYSPLEAVCPGFEAG